MRIFTTAFILILLGTLGAVSSHAQSDPGIVILLNRIQQLENRVAELERHVFQFHPPAPQPLEILTETPIESPVDPVPFVQPQAIFTPPVIQEVRPQGCYIDRNGNRICPQQQSVQPLIQWNRFYFRR